MPKKDRSSRRTLNQRAIVANPALRLQYNVRPVATEAITFPRLQRRGNAGASLRALADAFKTFGAHLQIPKKKDRDAEKEKERQAELAFFMSIIGGNPASAADLKAISSESLEDIEAGGFTGKEAPFAGGTLNLDNLRKNQKEDQRRLDSTNKGLKEAVLSGELPPESDPRVELAGKLGTAQAGFEVSYNSVLAKLSNINDPDEVDTSVSDLRQQAQTMLAGAPSTKIALSLAKQYAGKIMTAQRASIKRKRDLDYKKSLQGIDVSAQLQLETIFNKNALVEDEVALASSVALVGETLDSLSKFGESIGGHNKFYAERVLTPVLRTMALEDPEEVLAFIGKLEDHRLPTGGLVGNIKEFQAAFGGIRDYIEDYTTQESVIAAAKKRLTVEKFDVANEFNKIRLEKGFDTELDEEQTARFNSHISDTYGESLEFATLYDYGDKLLKSEKIDPKNYRMVENSLSEYILTESYEEGEDYIQQAFDLDLINSTELLRLKEGLDRRNLQDLIETNTQYVNFVKDFDEEIIGALYESLDRDGFANVAISTAIIESAGTINKFYKELKDKHRNFFIQSWKESGLPIRAFELDSTRYDFIYDELLEAVEANKEAIGVEMRERAKIVNERLGLSIEEALEAPDEESFFDVIKSWFK